MGKKKSPVPKPKPGAPKWKFGWYEIRKSIFTGGTALIGMLSYAATSENIESLAGKPGVIMAGITAFLTFVRFIHECRKDNTIKT